MNKLKLFLVLVAVATAGSFLFVKPASALNPNDIPGGMRNDISNYDSGCPGMPEKYALYTWVSPSGAPTQTSLTVPYGTQDVNLDLNQLVFVCRQYVNTNGASYPGLPQDGTVSPTAYNGSLSRGTSGFGATNGSLQNIGALQSQSSIFRNNATRYWFSNPVQFTYHANSPLTSSQVINVSFNQKFANIFGGSIACAVPPGPGGYVGSLENCNEGLVSFTITVNVNAPQWSLSATASASRVTMFPGETATFSYNLRNNGPDTASFQYVTRVQEYINGVPQAINPVSRPNGDGSWPVPNAVQGGLPAGASVSAYSVRGYAALANPNLTRVCSWIEYAPRSSSNGAPAASNQACINITQPVPNCAAFNITPSTIEPGVPFTALASVTYQSQQAAFWTYQSGGRLFVTITGPSYNQTQTYPGSPPVAADISYSGFAFPAPATAGVYTVTYGVQGGAIGSKNCSSTMKVAFSPYFRAQGGNVLAGAGFGTGCTTAPAKITSWNKYTGGATPYYGAGTDLAAIALGQITGFVSGNGQNGASTTNLAQAPNNLTFGNSGAGVPNNIPATIYGGAYGVNNWCMPDYAADAAADPIAQTAPNINAIGIGSLPPGDYVFTLTGNQNLGAPMTVVPTGVRITIVINGDLTLGGDVTYAPYGSLNDIPRLQIFVKGGNISIRKGVSVLTGVYGAQKSGGVGGQIDTCAEPSWTFSNCNGALTFYGTVFADQVLLKRMAGTSKDPTTAAETFVYGPETWLGRNFAVPDTAWQSATSLSPVL